jgi:RHS repeat-associated protein
LTSSNIQVNPGDQVTFGGRVYLESGGSSWQPGWSLGVRDANRIAINWISPSPPASSGWTYQSGTFTVPSGAAYVWLYATVYQNTTTTAMRVNDGFLDVHTNYYLEDMLGTSRVSTTNTGVVCYDADFHPYGGQRTYTNICPQDYKFEGKERDTETGNDDFGARYYSNRFGRWLSADWSSVPAPVPYANLSNPQTLNLYAMVSDDPESFADLDGHYLNWRRRAHEQVRLPIGQFIQCLRERSSWHVQRQPLRRRRKLSAAAKSAASPSGHNCHRPWNYT